MNENQTYIGMECKPMRNFNCSAFSDSIFENMGGAESLPFTP